MNNELIMTILGIVLLILFYRKVKYVTKKMCLGIIILIEKIFLGSKYFFKKIGKALTYAGKKAYQGLKLFWKGVKWLWNYLTPHSYHKIGFVGYALVVLFVGFVWGIISLIILLINSWSSWDLPTVGISSGWMTGIAIAIGLIVLFSVFRKRIPSVGSIRRFKISKLIWNSLAVIIVFYVCVWIFNSFRMSFSDPGKNEPQQATEATHGATPVRAIDTRERFLVNTPQLLKAGTKYVWDRKCRTIYYFEPVNEERAVLTYRSDRHPEKYLTGEMVRYSNEYANTDFFPKKGRDPMTDGLYTVTVDRDITIVTRTD